MAIDWTTVMMETRFRRFLRPATIATLLVALTVATAGCSKTSADPLPYDPETEVLVSASTYENYATVDEMVRGSDLIARGIVTGWEPGRIIPGGEESTELITVTVRIIDVLQGTARVGDTVSFPWEAWELRSDETRGRIRLVEGIRVPEPGNELVLFLRDLPDDQERAMKVRPTHYLATFDGIFDVRGDKIVSSLIDRSNGESPRVGIQLSGLSYEELKALVANR